jgi:hypothetical protein
VDVYELIIKRGTLGALKYANQIENKNLRLASQIDEAVIRLCKNAGMTGMIRTAQDLSNLPYTPLYPVSPQNYNYIPAPSTPSEQFTPEYDPSEYTTGYYRPKEEKKDNNNFGEVSGLASNLVVEPLAKYQAGKIGLLSKIFNARLKTFENLLKDGRFSEATKILNNTPKELNFTKPEIIRKKFLDVAEKELGGKGSPAYKKFIFDAAGSLKQNLYENVTQSRYTKKIPGIQYTALGRNWHPAIQQLSEFGGLTAGQKNMLRGQTIEQIEDIISKPGSNFPKTFIQEFENKGFSLAEKFLQKAPSAKEGVLRQGLQLAAEKFPALGKVLPILGKALGPISLVLEGKGLFDDVDKYGWDNKTICNLLSLLAGAVTVIAPLTGVGAPVAAVSGALWAALGVGCIFVQHGKPLEGKSDASDKENVNDISDENVLALKGKVKMSDLSDKDKRISQEIYDQYKDDRDELIAEFNSNALAGRFDKPVSVLAGVQTQLDGGRFFE